MPQNISLKALIVSNIAHWCLVISSMTMVIVFSFAGATLASDGTSSAKAILADLQSSPMVAYSAAFASVIATMPAGYIAAKMAPRDKLLNGALSTAGWLLFCLYVSIWGTGGHSKTHIPHWFDFLTSYGLFLPALAGAYIWQRRAGAGFASHQMAAPMVMAQQRETAPASGGSAPTQSQRRTRAATGLGVFIVIVSNILLTKHEQDVMFFGSLALIAIMLVAAFAAKALRSPRPRT
jgi:hypothetical protein